MTNLNELWIDGNLLENEDLSSLNNLSSLTRLVMRNNPNVTSLQNIIANLSLNFFIATELGELDFSTNDFWTKTDGGANILKLGRIDTLRLDSKYSLILANSATVQVDVDCTSEQFAVLVGNEYVRNLDISNCKEISNQTLQDVLKTLPNLTWLCADGSNLSSLEFLDYNPTDSSLPHINPANLNMITLYFTNISDISPLCKATNLSHLRINYYVPFYKEGDVAFNNKIKTIIECLSSHCGYNWDCEFLRSKSGGINNSGVSSFSFGSQGIWDDIKSGGYQIENFATVAYLYPGDDVVNADLISAGVKNIGNVNMWYAQFHFGSSVEIIEADQVYGVFLSNAENLSRIDVGHVADILRFEEGVTDFSSSCSHIRFNNCWDTADLSTIFALRIETPYVYFGCNKVYWPLDTSGLVFKSELRNLRLDALGGISDYSGILRQTNLETLALVWDELYSINASFEALTNLKTLYLESNYLTDLDFINNTVNKNKLEILNLSNNSFDDGTTRIDGKKICEFLSEFPKLKDVDLSGNSGIKDFSALINAGFTDDGGHHFTRTLSEESE